MENIKQHFLDMPYLQECWYDNDGNMIHYAHPLYTNHISRGEALQIKDAKPAKSESNSKDKNEK